MILNPFRLYRRWRRLQREAREEAWLARRKHGDEAAWALKVKLSDPQLTRWGRRVLKRAVRLL